MPGQSIRVSTDQVAQIANEIEALNKRLSEELKECSNTMHSLRNIWTGKAADTTIQSFDQFASKFFQKYEDVITQYVKFLRTNVDQAYTAVENANIKLGESFK